MGQGDSPSCEVRQTLSLQALSTLNPIPQRQGSQLSPIPHPQPVAPAPAPPHLPFHFMKHLVPGRWEFHDPSGSHPSHP